MNRREATFALTAGATAGALAAGAMVTVAPAAAEAPLAGRMSELISQAKEARAAWGSASNAEDIDPTPKTKAAFRAASAAYDAALVAMLSHRPVTVQEAGERLEWLFDWDGPWAGMEPSQRDVDLLVESYRRA